MRQGTVVTFSLNLAVDAARISASLRLPMADRITLATARTHGAVLWTQDADFEGLEGVRYLAKSTQ